MRSIPVSLSLESMKPSKKQIGTSLQALFTKAFEVAKKECCDFSEMGPRKIKSYCWTSKDHQCQLLQNLTCEWFSVAVLPTNPDLAREWERAFKPEQATVISGAWVKSARCQCGRLFRSRSNRQIMCDEFSKKHRRIKQREYRSRNRGTTASKRALRGDFFQ
jgi:hypothetical protein